MRLPALVLTLLVAALAAPGAAAGSTSAAPSVACAAANPAKTVRSARVGEDSIPIENDSDCDEWPNSVAPPGRPDNCQFVKNYDQRDTDGDGVGDACDDDSDADGVPDATDNCRFVANPGQEDNGDPTDGVGAACVVDTDGDGIIDPKDNCPGAANPGQHDTDGDTYGDACDGDDDDDYRLDVADNCPLAANPDQADTDGDGRGNACDDSASVVTPPVTGGGGGDAGGSPGAPADRTAPTIRVRGAKVQRRPDAAGGMPISVRCSEACAVVAQITVSGRDARRLGIARRSARPVVVARGDAALAARGATYVFFDLTRAAKRRLFQSPKVRATITLRVSDAASNVLTARRGVTFRR